MVDSGFGDLGQTVEVLTDHGPVQAKVVARPFYDPKKKIAVA
jgi:aminomethyltransferase